MNENKKSAIEQMVEMLDKKVATFIEKCGGVDKLDYFEAEYIEPYHLMLKEARRLLKEEQAQKPTAPAGLVEELDNLIMESPCNPTPHENMDFKNGVQLILSRYRPAPSSDEDCFSGLETAIKHYRDNGIDSMGLEAIESHIRLSRRPAAGTEKEEGK